MEGTRLHQSNVRSSKVPDVQSVWSASCTQAASARPPLSRSQREGEVEFQLRIGERVDGVNASAESWRLDKAREKMHTCTAVIKAVHAARGQVLSSLYTRLSNNFRSPVQTVQKEKDDPLHPFLPPKHFPVSEDVQSAASADAPNDSGAAYGGNWCSAYACHEDRLE